MTDQHARIGWNGQVPVSLRFDDPYYSLAGGLDETRYVFLDGNGLPGRLAPGFHVAELGVGTGLNLLALARMVQESGVTDVHYTGFEAYPMDRASILSSLSVFTEVTELAEAFAGAFTERRAFTAPGLTASFVFGDARETLPGWTGAADAWFLDGFAPAKNPEMWTPDLMQAVADRTRPGGTAATYTAAGAVRRALSEAGFDVTRRPGFGRKRHMTLARLP